MWNQSKTNIELTGHRGCKDTFPENTMESFSEALRLRVDVLEYDVHLCRTGELVIMHDAQVERTTDGRGALSFMTYDEIKLLDAGVKFGEQWRGCRVPTLEQTLRLVKNADYELSQIIEIKDFRPECIDKTVELVRKYDLVEATVIEAGDAPSLLYIQKEYPEFKTLAFPSMFMKRPYDEVYDKVFGIAISFNAPRLRENPTELEWWVKFADERGIQLFFFSGDNKQQIDFCVSHGATNITSNNPAAVIDYMRELGVRK